MPDTLLQLAIFAVMACPGYFVAALTIDRLRCKTIQVLGFAWHVWFDQSDSSLKALWDVDERMEFNMHFTCR